MKKILLALPILLVAALIGGTLYWYFVLSQKPTSTGTPSPTPASVKKSSVTLGELVLCKDFQKTVNEISCEDALGIAKQKYSGIVQKISKSIFRTEKDAQSPETDIWRIEIRLNLPIVKNNKVFDGVRLLLRRETGEEILTMYTIAKKSK